MLFSTYQIYDATNSNRARRQAICDYLTHEEGFKILFIESICTDTAVIEANIRVCFTIDGVLDFFFNGFLFLTIRAMTDNSISSNEFASKYFFLSYLHEW
jgi:hypothetical protein